MKKFFRFIIILSVILIVFSSCVKDEKTDLQQTDTQQTDTKEDAYPQKESITDTNHKEESQETPQQEDTEDDDYKDIVCATSDKSIRKHLTFEGSSYGLRIFFPSTFSIKKATESSYNIAKDNTSIGKIVYGEVNDESWTTVDEKSKEKENLTIKCLVQKNGTGKTLKFRRCFVITAKIENKSHTFTFTSNYEEIDQKFEDKILANTSLVKISDTSDFGVLKDTPKRSSVLILGNSFVGSSQIGEIFEEMCRRNGRNINAEWHSRGYAEISTYTNDVSVMNAIRSGKYSTVFITCFYDEQQMYYMKVLKDACKSSNTKLVICPAHNISDGIVKMMCVSNRDLVCLNWKNEITTLISSGVNMWDMCIQDSHNHSTPLAGYVGAHMMYRAMFNAIPKIGVSSTISQNYIDEKLGLYSKTGITYNIPTREILLFKK